MGEEDALDARVRGPGRIARRRVAGGVQVISVNVGAALPEVVLLSIRLVTIMLLKSHSLSGPPHAPREQSLVSVWIRKEAADYSRNRT